MADQKQEVGALWKKTSDRTGTEYYTGDIDVPGAGVVKVIGFNNDRKTSNKHPDIRLYLQEERGGNNSRPERSDNYHTAQPQSRAAQPTRTQTPPPMATIEYPEEEINPEDIPF